MGIATIGTTSPVPAGLIGDVLIEEPYSLAHPAGHPDPRSLPLVDWHESCGSCTRAWWAGQDWIPKATVLTEDDGAVLSMVSRGTAWPSRSPSGLSSASSGPPKEGQTVKAVSDSRKSE